MSFIFVCFSGWHEQQLSHQHRSASLQIQCVENLYLTLWLNIYLTIIDKCVTVSHTEEKSKLFEHWRVQTLSGHDLKIV